MYVDVSEWLKDEQQCTFIKAQIPLEQFPRSILLAHVIQTCCNKETAPWNLDLIGLVDFVLALGEHSRQRDDDCADIEHEEQSIEHSRHDAPLFGDVVRNLAVLETPTYDLRTLETPYTIFLSSRCPPFMTRHSLLLYLDSGTVYLEETSSLRRH